MAWTRHALAAGAYAAWHHWHIYCWRMAALAFWAMLPGRYWPVKFLIGSVIMFNVLTSLPLPGAGKGALFYLHWRHRRHNAHAIPRCDLRLVIGA